MSPERITPLIDTLVDTLRAEADALDELNGLLDRQLEALRAGTPEKLAELAVKTHECTAELDTLRQKRTRQTRLVGRVLGVEAQDTSVEALIAALDERPSRDVDERLPEACAAIENRTQKTQQRGETLRFALQYAAELNRELLAAMHGAADGVDGQMYTATGQSQGATANRSFVNAIG